MHNHSSVESLKAMYAKTYICVCGGGGGGGSGSGGGLNLLHIVYMAHLYMMRRSFSAFLNLHT